MLTPRGWWEEHGQGEESGGREGSGVGTGEEFTDVKG